MKYTIVWHEISERVYEANAESFDEAMEMLKHDWNEGSFENEGALLFNEFVCDETGEKDIEFNGYW